MSTEAPAATVETPAAPAADAGKSPDAILREAAAAMDAKNPPEVKPAEPKPEVAATGTEDPTPEPVKPAEEPKPAEPDPTPAQARAILRDAEKKLAEAKGLTAKSEKEFFAELLKSPKAALAKHGKTVDDLIDSSLAEEGTPTPAGEAKDERDERIAKLEQRLAQRDEQEQQARVDAKVSQIHADIAKDARFPTVNARNASGVVTDYMFEHFAQHGTAISWEKAATVVENDLRGPAPKAAPAPVAAAPAATAVRPAAPTTLTGEARDYVPPDESQIPKDPQRALEYIVRHAYEQFGEPLARNH